VKLGLCILLPLQVSTWLYIREGGSAQRDLAVSMLTPAFAHTFPYTALYKGGIEKNHSYPSDSPKNANKR